jgi:solute carrier family 25 oxoglutarate transporter 11
VISESVFNWHSFSLSQARITREEGLATFWRGSSPFMIRAALVGASQVATYDQFKLLFHKAGVPDGIPIQFTASMSAGLVYSVITMPFESAKNRMAFQKPDPITGHLLFRGTFQTISHVVRQTGVASLWSGFLPYYVRCGGHTVVMFIAIEQLRTLQISLGKK